MIVRYGSFPGKSRQIRIGTTTAGTNKSHFVGICFVVILQHVDYKIVMSSFESRSWLQINLRPSADLAGFFLY